MNEDGETATNLITQFEFMDRKTSFTVNIGCYKTSEIWRREKKASQPTNPY